jgi:hypothetical protein
MKRVSISRGSGESVPNSADKKIKKYNLLATRLKLKLENSDEHLKKDYENDKKKLDLLDRMKSPCSDELGPLISWKYPMIDYEKISNLVKEQFYNPTVMETMSCLVMSGLNSEQNYMDLLKDIKIIDLGTSKSDMIVFFSNLSDGKNKVLTFKYDGDDILNEAVIGMIMNLFRDEIPTFTWTYGLTKCNLPMFMKDKNQLKMISACREPVQIGQGDYIGLITEYIDGPTLGKYLVNPSISLKRFRSAMLTIFYSLKYANLKLKYVHWDLHDSNILMRSLNSKDNYLYLKYDNQYLYVGDHLATIIDFGFNSLVKSKQLIGNFNRADIGINPELSMSSKNDLLKLLNYLYIELKENANKSLNIDLVYQDLSHMFLFFVGVTKESDLEKFSYELTKRYALFPNDAGGEIIDNFFPNTIENMIDYLVKKDPSLVVSQKPNSKILNCEQQPENCLDAKEVMDILFSRQDRLNGLTDLIGYSNVLKNETQTELLISSIRDYLDQIFNRLESITNQPLISNIPMIILMNELRWIDSDLIQLNKIATEMQLKDMTKQISNMKRKLIAMIKKYEKIGLKAFYNNQYMLEKLTKVPDSQKQKLIEQMETDFLELTNKYKLKSSTSSSPEMN